MTVSRMVRCVSDAPKYSAIAWHPRQIPRIGLVCEHKSIAFIRPDASAGKPGRGDYKRIIIINTVKWNFIVLTTFHENWNGILLTQSLNSPIMLWTNESWLSIISSRICVDVILSVFMV